MLKLLFIFLLATKCDWENNAIVMGPEIDILRFVGLNTMFGKINTDQHRAFQVINSRG